jgi:hypothetical protein
MFYNNTYHGDNNWETPTEPTSTDVDRYASAMTTITKIINTNTNSTNINADSNKRQNTLISKRDSRILGTLIRNGINDSAAEGGAKKKKGWYEIMNEMSVHDIPWENNEDQIKQDNEFEDLRKEKENEIRMKENEIKMKIKEEKELQLKKKEEANKQNKYKNKKITIDANGNVIIIKPFDMNILEKDFISIRSNSKNIKRMQPPSAVALHKQQPSNHKKQLPTIETSTQPSHTQQAQSNIEKKIERGPVVPVGSCFDKMKPEIGVCITEDKRSKTGGKDFFKKFNKYSLENYTKELQSTLNANMTYTAGGNNSNNNNFGFTHSSNYMMNSELHNRTLTDVNNYYYNTITNSSFGKKSISNKANHTAYNPLIKLSSTTNQFNLKCTLDDLNLISEQDEATAERNNINNNTQYSSFNISNIFKPLTSRNTNSNFNNTLTDMNTFASSLLKPTLTTTTHHQRKQQQQPLLPHAMKPSKPKREFNTRLPRMRQHILMSKTFHNT